MSILSTILYRLSTVLLFTTVWVQSSAQNLDFQNTEPLKLQRINSPVKLDGLSNEAAWIGIQSFPIVMRMPNFGTEPSEHTEILLAYDDDYIYIAGRLYDKEPSKIQAISFKRDGGWHWNSDHLGVFFDTFNDNENAELFAVTPSGTRTDINIKNDGEGNGFNNLSWNTFWDATSVINEEGWFTEMRIPFSSLRFEEKDGQIIMGITTYRLIARKFEMDIFPLVPEKFDVMGFVKPSQAQKVIFEGIKSHNPLYITPYILGGIEQSNKLNEANSAYIKNEAFAREAGLDIKYGLTNNLTLDVTINPDFAQVEADDQMINLTRFSLFFPEKRLFFQERQGNFEFNFEDNNRLFYSRRIGLHDGNKVRIYGGARVVGRIGEWDIGFLNLQTEKFEDLLSENFNVFRLRKQVINPYSYVGGAVTTRIGDNNNWNSVYGLDGVFRLFGDDYLTLKWAQSFESDEINPFNSLSPSKIYTNWTRRNSKGFGYNLNYSRSGEYFNPGIGYERRNNFTRFGDRVHYGWYPDETSKFLKHQAFIQGIAFIGNNEGLIESSQLGFGWQFETKTNTYGSVSINQFKENITTLFLISDDVEVPIGEYTFYGLDVDYQFLRGSPYRINTRINTGSFYDGQNFSVSLNPAANLSAHLELEGMYQINLVEFPDRNQQFTGHIVRIKISAFLNNKLSLVSIAQYNSAIDKMLTNVRFRFNPSEGHDLYIVYDEGLNTNRQRELITLPGSNNRTIMLKYSYTFKLVNR